VVIVEGATGAGRNGNGSGRGCGTIGIGRSGSVKKRSAQFIICIAPCLHNQNRSDRNVLSG